MNALTYLIQVNLYLVLFYGLYHLILRNETFFKMNRMYLVGSVILALAIPLLKAEWIKDLFVTEQVYQATQKVSNFVSDEQFINEVIYLDESGSESTVLTPAQIFWLFYGSITLLFLINFFRRLYIVNKALNGSVKNQAFSFFNKVLVDEHLEGKNTIIDHEMVHVKQWHSLDVIFFELFAAFNWFNPIAFLYKKAIKNIHEFIADETAASTLEDKSEYALLMVSNAFGTQPDKLTNSFYNNSLLKRRLIMLNKNKSRKVAILKYGLSVPLFAVMIILSSATIARSETIQNITETIEGAIPQVVEAVTDRKLVSETHTLENTAIEKKADDETIENLANYFNRSIKYPYSDQEAEIRGSAIATFEIDLYGKISKPRVLRSISEANNSEILRVLNANTTFKKELRGKYYLRVKYSLKEAPNFPALPEYDYGKDQIDLTYLKEYKSVGEIHLRGYLKTPESTQGSTLPAVDDTEKTKEFSIHLMRSLRYPAIAQQNNEAGFNLLSFEIDKNGNVTNPNIIKAHHPSMGTEILRVLKSAPNLSGMEGKYILPVMFLLSGSEPQPKLDLEIDMSAYEDYKKLGEVVIRGYAKQSNNSIKAMQDHLTAFFKDHSVDRNKGGTIFVGFDVADKKPSNYRIIRSINAKWEKDLLKHFERFNDTVGLVSGTYYFYKRLGRPSDTKDNTIVASKLPTGYSLSFGQSEITKFTYTTAEETEKGVKKIVNYILVDYLKNPVILIDGKIAKYKKTEKGFKLENTIYPKHADIQIHEGDDAVANYNKSVKKKGLIVVKTK